MKPTASAQRQVLLDFFRSGFMLFVFYHHVWRTFPHSPDHFARFNPFAELFVLLSGFMVGLIYLERKDSFAVVRRGLKVLGVYFLIGIPVAIGRAVMGAETEPVIDAVLAVVLLQADWTMLDILRFYGLIFLFLPLVFRAYRLSQRWLFYASAAVFLLSTHLFHLHLHETEAFFRDHVLMMVLQWQFLFIIGIFLGNRFKHGQLLGGTFYIGLAVLFVIGLFGDAHIGFLTVGEKSPYNFEKFINLLWAAPTVLLLFYGTFRLVGKLPATEVVLSVGRNSLFAFGLSEVVVQFFTLVLRRTDVLPPTWLQMTLSLAGVVVLTGIVWWYSRLQRARPLSGEIARRVERLS